MAFTPQEQAVIDRLKAEGKSADEIAAYIGGQRLGSPSSLHQAEIRQTMKAFEPQPQVQTDPFLTETTGDITQTLTNITQRWAGSDGAFEFGKQAGERVAQAAVREEGEGFWQNVGQTFGQATRSGLQIWGEYAGAAADTLGELFIGAGKIVLPESGEQAVADVFQQAIAPIAESPKIQQMIADYEWLKANNPNKAADVRAALGGINMLAELVGYAGAKPVVGEVAGAVSRAGRQVDNLMTPPVRPSVTPGVTPGVTPPVRPSVTPGVTPPVETGEAVINRVRDNIVSTADTISRMANDERVRLQRIKNSDPVVADAYRANVPETIINQYVSADNATKPVYRELVEAYKAGDAETRVPEIYARIAGEQYKTVTDKLDDLGRQYEEAFDTLPGGTVDMRPVLEGVQARLAQAGARFDDAGRMVDAGRSFTPDEAEWVKKLYDTLYKYGDDVNYKDLRTGDEVLSRINREAYAKDVTPPRIDGENLSTIMRDAIREQIDNVLPEYRQLNNEYRQTIQFKDALDKTIFDTGRQIEGVKINAAEATETNLRRLFSNAKSKTTYRAVADALDDFARQNGYEGSRLSDVARFHIEIQNVYPDQMPKASFGGGIRGILGSFLTGQTDVRMTQEALEKMVGAGKGNGTVQAGVKAGAVVTGAYLYSEYVDDSGVVAPAAFAAMASLPPNARRKVVDEMVDTAAKAGKKVRLSEADKRIVAQALEEYDTAPIDVKVMGKDVMSPPNDADFRLMQLKTKNDGGTFTDADAIEARALLEDRGALGKPQSATTKTTTDPTLKTKREVNAKDVAGNKFTIKAGEVIEPRINEKGQAIIKVGKNEYTIPKNQYDNLKGQSDAAVASPFAPELEGTEVTVRGAVTGDSKAKAQALLDRKGYVIEEDMMETYITKNGEVVEYDDMPSDIKKAYDTIIGDAEIREDIDRGMATKYSQYTLPGGEDYREIIVRAPVDDSVRGVKFLSEDQYQYKYAINGKNVEVGKGVVGSRKAADEYMERLAKDKDYNGVKKDPHWDEENPQFWVRMNKRDWNGKHVEFMEEAQKAKTLNEEMFKKGWQIPATKKALMDAVDRDGDIFAWINGEQTSERYKLSTQVESVKWTDGANAGQDMYRNSARVVDIIPQGKEPFKLAIDETGTVKQVIGGSYQTQAAGQMKGKRLDEVLGKGMADSIMSKKSGTLEGEGLNFGGEWAHNLYDKQVRDIVRKLTGAEVKKADMGLGTGNEKGYRIPIGEIGNSQGVDATVSNVKKGILIRKKSDSMSEPEEYYVIGKNRDGSINVLASRHPELEIANEEALYNKYLRPVADSTSAEHEAIQAAIKDGVFDKHELIEKITLGKSPETQQYIELTPEVKAKIRSEAPKFKMKNPSAGEALPLILLMLGGGTVAANQ